MLLRHEKRVDEITRHIPDPVVKGKVVNRLNDFMKIVESMDKEGDSPTKLDFTDNVPHVSLETLNKREEEKLSRIIVEDIAEEEHVIEEDTSIEKPNMEVNLRGDRGYTPLIRATMDNNKEEVLSLLALGADPRIEDKYGFTAYQKAMLEGFDEIAAILRPYTE